MNKIEALQMLRDQLTPWRRRTYAELSNEIDGKQLFEVTGPSGAWYQGDIRVLWDDQPQGAIRVSGAIDDGGWRACVPLTDSFIMAPDGGFVGE